MDAILDMLSGLPAGAQIGRALVLLLVAAVCGAIIGGQREHLGKPAGLRTHMLVATGSALFVGIGVGSGMSTADLSRLIQGLATGVGFLGAGAILKGDREHEVTGLTTAAGIWMTSAIGVAVGVGQFGTALLATAVAWVILAVVGYVERWHEGRARERDRKP